MDFIPSANTFIDDKEADEVYKTVKSGWISMGKKVEEFEEKIKAVTGAKYAVAMNNGTSTLHAALLTLNVAPGDEVIVPTLTYISSANMVLQCGAKVVLCDSDFKTYNTTTEQIEAVLTPKTKVILTVDLKGMSVDYDPIMNLAQRNNIAVLADSAETLSAEYKNKKVGTQADVHSFSFFANKNITTGEGGMLTTDDEDLYTKMKMIRNQGQDSRFHHIMMGNNYRMTDVLAAIGSVQVDRLDWIIEEKSKIAKFYDDNFADDELIETPYIPDYATQHSWYLYCVMLDESVDRDGVIQYMREKNVDSRLSFPPVHIQPYYVEKFGYNPEDYPESYRAYSHFIDIPIWAGMTLEQQERVINSVRDGVRQNRIR